MTIDLLSSVNAMGMFLYVKLFSSTIKLFAGVASEAPPQVMYI